MKGGDDDSSSSTPKVCVLKEEKVKEFRITDVRKSLFNGQGFYKILGGGLYLLLFCLGYLKLLRPNFLERIFGVFSQNSLIFYTVPKFN